MNRAKADHAAEACYDRGAHWIECGCGWASAQASTRTTVEALHESHITHTREPDHCTGCLAAYQNRESA